MFAGWLYVAYTLRKIITNKELPATLTESLDGQPSVNVRGTNIDAFQARMKVLVDKLGSIAEIARKSGMTPSTIKNWVDGISDPSRERCITLANGTGASVLWLVTGEGPLWSADAEKATQALIDKASHTVRLDEGTLAQAVGLLQGILVGRGELSPGDYAQALIGFYEVLSAPSEPNALAGKVIELSHFVAQRAKQGT